MHSRWVLLLVLGLLAFDAVAHPGAAIAVGSGGRVYFVDTGSGVYVIEPGGRIVRHEGPAFHWFAFDAQGRYRRTPWPRIPGAEFRSAGAAPTLVLSSDFPVVIGADGKFYYPDGSGPQIRIVRIEPSGAGSTHATLPPITRGGESITWLNGLAPGPNGSLYYTEDAAVRKVDARGRVSTIANRVVVPNCTSIPGIGVERPYLRGLAVTPDGSVYVAASGCGALLKIDRRGSVHTVLRTIAPWAPTAVAVANGEVYVLEYSHTASDDRTEWLPRILKISRKGAVSVVGGIKR